MNYESMTLLINGRPVINDQQSLTASGVKDGDVLQALPFNAQQLMQQQMQHQSNQPTDYRQKALELMRTAPRYSSHSTILRVTYLPHLTPRNFDLILNLSNILFLYFNGTFELVSTWNSNRKQKLSSRK